MRINYTLWSAGYSGGVRVIFRLARGLARKGHKVTVTNLIGGRYWDGSKNIEIISPRVPPFFKYLDYVLSIKLGFPLISTRYLANAVPECDVNVATLCLTAPAVYKSQTGVPFYHMQHYETLTMKSHLAKIIAEKTYRLPIKKIANSIWLRDIVYDRFGEKASIVNPGIDTDVFHSRSEAEENERKQIVCLGKSLIWKGLEDLFAALKIVRKSVSNIVLIMYGSEPGIQAPIPYKYVFKPNDVHLAEIYSSADVVVCPSWFESFPLPPLEAMACGAPVVTTRYGTEDFAFNEENSLVVPPRKPKLMAEAIVRVLTEEELKHKFRKKGFETARKFSWDRAIDKVEKIFEKSLGS